MTYKDFVIGGFAMILPVLLNSWQGAEIESLTSLDAKDYNPLRFNTLYRVLGSIVAILGGFGSLAYYTGLRYRELEKKDKEKDTNQTGDNSGSKERAMVWTSSGVKAAKSPQDHDRQAYDEKSSKKSDEI